MLKEKYISEAQMKEEPKKKLVLKIKEGSITPEHFNKMEVENYLQEVVGSIEDTGMLPEDKAKLDALPTAEELEERFEDIQEFLTFDDTPTAGSDNPVKSQGIKTALDALDGRIDAIIGGNATLNLSVSPASIFANTSASVTVTATASMQATSINIKKGGTTVQSGSNTTSINYTETVSLSSGETITYSAEGVINGVTKTVSNKTVRAYDKIYSGVGTESSYANLTANSNVKTSANGTYNFSFSAQSASKYIYILVPNSMSAIDLSSVKLGSGFGYNLSLIASNVNYAGDGVLYRVYRSVEENNANVKLIIG